MAIYSAYWATWPLWFLAPRSGHIYWARWFFRLVYAVSGISPSRLSKRPISCIYTCVTTKLSFPSLTLSGEPQFRAEYIIAILVTDDASQQYCKWLWSDPSCRKVRPFLLWSDPSCSDLDTTHSLWHAIALHAHNRIGSQAIPSRRLATSISSSWQFKVKMLMARKP
jgi:hypothetical protein